MSKNRGGNGAGSNRLFTKLGRPRVRGGEEQIPADLEILREALAAAIEATKEAGWDTVWYVTQAEESLDRHDTHQQALGNEIFTAMRSESGANVDGITLKSVSIGNLTARGVSGGLLVLYPDPEMLNQLDELRQPHGVVIVPWIDQPDDWNEKWGATPI